MRVPATSGNLGPGFDALGLALALYNEVTARASATWSMETKGEGAGELPPARGNLLHEAYVAAFRARKQQPVPLAVRVAARIPVARGLGSSAAAIAAGICLAARLVRPALTLDEAIALGSRLEGHPDNVLAALVGGVTAGAMAGREVAWLRLTAGAGLRVVVLIPRHRLTTKQARGVLPGEVRMRDAVFNLSRAALLAGSLALGDARGLSLALADRLHQPYRAKLVPGLSRALKTARGYGAHGAYLSGAGPTLAMLFDAAAAKRALPRLQSEWRAFDVRALPIAADGAWRS